VKKRFFDDDYKKEFGNKTLLKQMVPGQGCQIGHFMANFEKFGHFLTALAMKKRIWPFCKIWQFLAIFSVLSL